MTSFNPGQLVTIKLETKDSDGVLFNADTINQLEILTPDRNILDTITTGWNAVSIGTYEYLYNMPTTLEYPYIIGRWKYTHNTYPDYREVQGNIAGA